MREVTYRGTPGARVNPRRYRDGDRVFPLGETVEAPNDVADRLRKVEGHKFDVASESTEGKD